MSIASLTGFFTWLFISTFAAMAGTMLATNTQAGVENQGPLQILTPKHRRFTR
jgi:hypothetical protein